MGEELFPDSGFLEGVKEGRKAMNWEGVKSLKLGPLWQRTYAATRRAVHGDFGAE
jgi:hypothetical protein